MRFALAGVVGTLLGSNACAGAGQPAAAAMAAAVDTAAIAHRAHEDYVNAINSNNLDSLMAMLTDDVVYQAPNGPEVVGKAAVREWGKAYLDAYTIHWEKRTLDFIIAGDWAFERYGYKEHDVPKAGGAAMDDVGKGLNVYRRGADGRWRVARDTWNSDLPAPTSN